MSRRRLPPAPAVIDTCCLIDLLVSGLAEEILRSNAFTWHLPTAVKDEVRYIRRYDPSQTGALINDPAKPLVNRAMKGVYPPGSTVKPLLALGGLEDGVRRPGDTVLSTGQFCLPGHARCYGAGSRKSAASTPL